MFVALHCQESSLFASFRLRNRFQECGLPRCIEVSTVLNIKASHDLLNDQLPKVLKDETFSVLQMIQQSSSYSKVSWLRTVAEDSTHTSCDQEVDTLFQLLSFRAAIGSSHDNSVSLGVLL